MAIGNTYLGSHETYRVGVVAQLAKTAYLSSSLTLLVELPLEEEHDDHRPKWTARVRSREL